MVNTFNFALTVHLGLYYNNLFAWLSNCLSHPFITNLSFVFTPAATKHFLGKTMFHFERAGKNPAPIAWSK